MFHIYFKVYPDWDFNFNSQSINMRIWRKLLEYTQDPDLDTYNLNKYFRVKHRKAKRIITDMTFFSHKLKQSGRSVV